MNAIQYNERNAYQVIARDINLGGIKTVTQLLARTGRSKLDYSVFSKLLKVMQARTK